MKVSTERIPDSQIVLEIQVDQDQVERSMDKAYRRLVQRVAVPGFRKGKTPRTVLERHVGRDRLFHEALDIIIPEAYTQAIRDHDVDAIDDPQFDLVTPDPLVFKATVPVRPTVELGDYRAIRVERDEVTLDAAEVQKVLDDLRARHAVFEPVNRPVQVGDRVRADVRLVIDGQEEYQKEDAEFHLHDGVVILLPGFAEGLVGAEKAILKEIPVTVPAEYGNLSGKTGMATVLVKEVKGEQLPELTDEFAREVSEEFQTIDALLERVRERVRARAEEQAEAAFRDRALTAVVDGAEKIEFPPVLVDREINRFVDEQARGIGMDVEAYLKLMKRTPQQLAEDLRPAAAERVKRALALGQLAEAEKIEVSDLQLDAEIEAMIEAYGTDEERARSTRALFSKPSARESVRRSMLTDKTIARLADIASGKADAAPEPEAEASETKEEEQQ